MAAYYNEWDAGAAAWLRELIKRGLIADGEVDERSILDVQADDFRRFTQHHFFSGIGGWSAALRLAGWPDDKPVCTASLPCQPFSVAGKQHGKDDERHLLPHFIELVKQCHWQTIIGEQVPGAIRHGWLDDLCDEMEREGYAVGAAVLTAAGAGAPHIRQRLFWVAYSNDKHGRKQQQFKISERARSWNELSGGCGVNGVADSSSNRHQGQGKVARPSDSTAHKDWEINRTVNDGSCSRSTGGMGDPKYNGHLANAVSGSHVSASEERRQDRPDIPRQSEGTSGHDNAASLSGRAEGCGIWQNPEWIYCRDGKYRPIAKGIQPTVRTVKSATVGMANGLSGGMVRSGDRSPEEPKIDYNNTQEARVTRLRGYGNAIVPQVAAEFIKATGLLDCA